MKKKSLIVSVIILAALMLTSCVSSVKINTMIPSQVDLTGYSSIRVEEPYVKGLFFSYQKDKIQSLTRDTIINALSEGNYTVVASGKSDAILSSEVRIDSNRSFVSAQKTDQKDKDGNTIYHFYLRQSAHLVFQYTLTDSRTGKILDSFSTRVAMPDYGYDETFLGESTDPNDKNFYKYIYTADDYVGDYEYAIKSLKKTLINRLVPHYKTVSISLMENKPEVEGLKDAYDAVSNGLYNEALFMFDIMWQRGSYVQAGYNSALLYYATGNQSEALNRAYEVWEKTGSSKALSLYTKLKGMQADDKLAKTQSGL